MSRTVTMTCTRCHIQQRVPRVDLDHRARPRCRECGGPLELSTHAAQRAAEARAKREGTGARPTGGSTNQPVGRLVPEREAKRYVFWEHPDLYRWILFDMERQGRPDVVRHLKEKGPVACYERQIQEALKNVAIYEQMASELVNRSELAMYRSGRPYFKVWPSILEALCHTEMRVDGEHFRMPYEGMELRFPQCDNPMAPACAAVAARVDGSFWTDGRDWSFVMVWFDDVPEYYQRDDAGQYWVADIPIRRGLSLEDALDQTALAREGPDPGLARRMMRVAVGTCFFGVDRHEVILPEVPRKILDRWISERKTPDPSEARKALQAAKDAGLFGFKVGSEIDLPTAEVRHHAEPAPGDEGRSLTEGHVRRGHMRLQACGPKLSERRLVFVAPTIVRPDLPLGHGTGYRVRIT